MKKFYFILMSSLAVLLLTFGIWTFVQMGHPVADAKEGRAEVPEFSYSALADGTYTAKLENYYADNFPFRDFFLKANRFLNKFYYFSPMENLLSIDYHGGAEQGGASLSQNDEQPGENSIQAPDRTSVEQPSEEEVTSVGTIIIHGNRAMDIPTAENDVIVRYGETVTKIAEALGSDIRVFSLVTPNSGEFYSPKSYHTGIHDQKAMIDLCYSSMGEKVTTVDAYSPIKAHAEEYLFFRTDHHWTQKGAYYAYTAFCDAAGFVPPALESYETGVYDSFVGSMHNYTSGYPQSKALQEEPDYLQYYLPPVQTKTAYYMDSSLTNGKKTALIDTVLDPEIENKYLCYISGDTPICVIESEAPGGTCLVLKESYGNAFVPFLTQHYAKIIAVDPREFSGAGEPTLDLPSFVAEQGVDDVLVLNYPFMMSNKAYIKYLEALL